LNKSFIYHAGKKTNGHFYTEYQERQLCLSLWGLRHINGTGEITPYLAQTGLP